MPNAPLMKETTSDDWEGESNASFMTVGVERSYDKKKRTQIKTFQGIRGRTSLGIQLVRKAKSNETRSGGVQDRMLALLEGQNRLHRELKEEQDRLKEEIKRLIDNRDEEGKDNLNTSTDIGIRIHHILQHTQQDEEMQTPSQGTTSLMGLLRIDSCETNQTMERIVNISQDTPLKRQKEEDEGCDRVTVHKKSEERNTLEMLNGTTISGTSLKRQK